MTWKKVRRRSIRRIQRYQHNYCLLSLTGCLGCRWKRYQQSKNACTPCDRVWLAVLLLAFCVSSLFIFQWLCAANEQVNLNYVLFSRLNYWVSWYQVVRSVAFVVYTYICFLMIVSLLHMCMGYQLYIHHVHRLALLLIIVLCIVGWSVFFEMATEFWSLFGIGLKIFGPYIQLSFVLVFTCVSWLVAGCVWKMERTVWRVTILVVFASITSIVYLSPLMSSYPCVCSRSHLPAKPRLIAHRGASALAPENTMAAFELAERYNVSVLEIDVSMTSDGQLYAFHDSRLTRTTNVDEVFPANTTMDFDQFTSDEIDQLQAGEWFVEYDPYGTAWSLESGVRDTYARQPVPKLSHVLDLVKRRGNLSLLLDVGRPGVVKSKEEESALREAVSEAIRTSGIASGRIYWMDVSDRTAMSAPTGTVPVMYGSHFPTSQLGEWSVGTLNTNYSQPGEETLRKYRHHSIDVFVHLVNVDWLFSYFWCVGVAGVSTDRVDLFSRMDSPTYGWEPRTYLLCWILSDCLSAAVITVIIIVQYLRRSGGRFIPDPVSMTVRRRGPMKEKLLYVVDRTSPVISIGPPVEGDMNGSYVNEVTNDSLDDDDDAISIDRTTISTIEHRRRGPQPQRTTTDTMRTNVDDVSVSDVSVVMDKY